MDSLEYLTQIRKMEAKINNDIDELSNLNNLATRTTVAFCGSRVQSTGNQQRMADYAVRIVELKQSINTEVSSYVDLKNQVLKTIHEACDADCCRLLYLRYFQFKTWEVIAEMMNFSREWIHKRLHKKALMQLQAELNEKYK